jgi:hypothetical protein
MPACSASTRTGCPTRNPDGKLKEIALRTNDETLLRQAEQLEARAWATYQERAGGSDEQALEQPAASRSAATLSGVLPPARPYPGKDGGLAAVKEVDR